MTLSQRVRQVLTIDPDSSAIITADRSMPWSYINGITDEIENVIAPLGAMTGLSIGLIARNRASHVAAIAACLAGGNCLVTLSPMFSDSALASDISTLRLHVIIGDRDDLKRPGILEAALATGAAIIETNDDPNHALLTVRDIDVKADFGVRNGVAIEMLSSGTTGVPKRISLTFDNLEAAMGPAAPRSTRSANTELTLQARPALVWLPIVHISGMYFVIEAIYSARPTILMERFDVEQWSSYVQSYGVRLAHLNPTAMRMILEANIEPSRLSSLRAIRGGTAATPPELQVAFENRFGVPVLTTYGATEFTGAIVSWSPEDHRVYGRSKIGSSGRAHPGVELRVVDPESGDALSSGQEGILEIRAPQAAGKVSSWSRTTDIAVIDTDDFLWIKGRADDAILRGGFKIHPEKIVAALEEHPDVYEAAVVGIADDRLGAVPVAAVTLTNDAGVQSPESLIDFLRTKLTAYEVPRKLLIIDALPLTPSMKVDRPALRSLFSE